LKLLRRKSQSGQSLIILAVSFVVLLGFSGLAIDGGILYSDRRHAQNAADAGALAGALAILQSGNPISTAFARVADNDYDNDGVRNWVEVHNPPIDGPYAGNPYYVQVRIRSKVDSVFAHFVYSGDLENTVTAVARAKPATVEPFMSGDAMVGLAKTGCSVVWSHGNNHTEIEGSGIFVNSDHPDCAFKASGSNILDVDTYIHVVGGFEISGGAIVNPTPLGGFPQIETPVIPPPSCSGSSTQNSGTGVITPGNTADFNFHGGSWTLQPGIYCVDGGFSVNSSTTITGHNVLIYVKTGDISWNGSATLNLDAPDDCEYANMLIYQDPGNTNMATINGGSGSTFSGTMFIPSAEVQINGTGSADGFHSQVIGNIVDMSGTADLHIIYDANENFSMRNPAQVELTQ
jgi:hypothetical protein